MQRVKKFIIFIVLMLLFTPFYNYIQVFASNCPGEKDPYSHVNPNGYYAGCWGCGGTGGHYWDVPPNKGNGLADDDIVRKDTENGYSLTYYVCHNCGVTGGVRYEVVTYYYNSDGSVDTATASGGVKYHRSTWARGYVPWRSCNVCGVEAGREASYSVNHKNMVVDAKLYVLAVDDKGNSISVSHGAPSTVTLGKECTFGVPTSVNIDGYTYTYTGWTGCGSGTGDPIFTPDPELNVNGVTIQLTYKKADPTATPTPVDPSIVGQISISGSTIITGNWSCSVTDTELKSVEVVWYVLKSGNTNATSSTIHSGAGGTSASGSISGTGVEGHSYWAVLNVVTVHGKSASFTSNVITLGVAPTATPTVKPPKPTIPQPTPWDGPTPPPVILPDPIVVPPYTPRETPTPVPYVDTGHLYQCYTGTKHEHDGDQYSDGDCFDYDYTEYPTCDVCGGDGRYGDCPKTEEANCNNTRCENGNIFDNCLTCKGSGLVDCDSCDGGKISCSSCSGKGSISCTASGCNAGSIPCSSCDGKGKTGSKCTGSYKKVTSGHSVSAFEYVTCSRCSGGGALYACSKCGAYTYGGTASGGSCPEGCGGTIGSISCTNCGGERKVPHYKCDSCGATGWTSSVSHSYSYECDVCGDSSSSSGSCTKDSSKDCESCDGKGSKDCSSCEAGSISCSSCDGKGEIACSVSGCTGGNITCSAEGCVGGIVTNKCQTCGGDGKIVVVCSICDGYGEKYICSSGEWYDNRCTNPYKVYKLTCNLIAGNYYDSSNNLCSPLCEHVITKNSANYDTITTHVKDIKNGNFDITDYNIMNIAVLASTHTDFKSPIPKVSEVSGFNANLWNQNQTVTLKFGGSSWYLDDAHRGANKYVTSTYNVYIDSSVKVTFDPRRGSVTPSSKTYYYGSTYGSLPTAVPEDHNSWKFCCWTTEVDNHNTQVTTGSQVVSYDNHVLYAHYVPVDSSYSVTYIVRDDGVEISRQTQSGYRYGQQWGTLPTVSSLYGHDGSGWHTSDGKEISSSTYYGYKSSITLYYDLESQIYTIPLYYNDGTGDVVYHTVQYDSTFGSISSLPTPSFRDSNRSFQGWYLDAACTSPDIDGIHNDDMVTKARGTGLALYAKSALNGSCTVAYTLSPNKGTLSYSYKDYPYKQKSGVYYQFPSVTPNYGYKADILWYYGSQPISTSHELQNNYENHTVTLKILPKTPLVEFNTNGGQWLDSASKLTFNAEYDATYVSRYGDFPSDVIDIKRDGFKLLRWTLTKSNTVNSNDVITQSEICTKAENHTLYAQWGNNKYTLQFDTTGLTSWENVNDFVVCYGYQFKHDFDSKSYYDSTDSSTTSYVLRELPDVYKAGYSFKGWSFDKVNVITSESFINETYLGCTNGVIKLYPLFESDNHIVTLNLNGGVANNSSFTVACGTPSYNNISSFSIRRDGYKFLGLYDHLTEGNKVYDSNSKAVEAKNFIQNNKKAYIDQSYWVDKPFIDASQLVWGYHGNVTLYAHWQPIEYYLHYADRAFRNEFITDDSSVNYTDFTVTYDNKTHSYDKVEPYSKNAMEYMEVTYDFNTTGRGYTNQPKWFSYVGDETHTISRFTWLGYEMYKKTAIGNLQSTGISYYIGNYPRELTITEEEHFYFYPLFSKTGEPINLPVPQMVGYRFIGWSESANSSLDLYVNTFTPVKKLPEKTVLYAHWEPETYRFILNPGRYDGRVDSTVYNCTFDSTLNNNIASANPRRTGYTFEGWYTTTDKYNNGTGTMVFDKYGNWNPSCPFWSSDGEWIRDGGCYLYARWEPITYTETFHININETFYSPTCLGCTTCGISYKQDTETDMLNISHKSTCVDTVICNATYDATTNNVVGSTFIPKKLGYTFDGWFTAPSGGNLVYDVNGKTYNTSGTSYYQSWWKNDSEYPVTNPGVSPVYKIASNIELYGHWTPNTYTLTFDYRKPAISTSVMTDNTITSKVVTFDSNVGVLPEPKMVGWKFEGWFTQPNGNGKQVVNGRQVTADTHYVWAYDDILYAYWTPIEYNVHYATHKIEFYNSSEILDKPCIISNDFVDLWYYDNFDKNHASTKNYTAKDDSDYVIKIQPNTRNTSPYTYHDIITYNLNKQQKSTTPYFTSYSGTLTDLAVDVVKDYNMYTFLHWQLYQRNGSTLTKLDGRTFLENEQAKNLTSVDGTDYVLFPVWEQLPDGVVLPTAACRGYNFHGWSLNNLQNVSDALSSPWKSTKDTTLYGIWTPKVYTVTLDDRGALSTSHTKSVVQTFDAYGADIVVPTKRGYTFQGYYLGKRGTGTKYYDANGKQLIPWVEIEEEVTTLYAYWTQDEVITDTEDPFVTPDPGTTESVDGKAENKFTEIKIYADDRDSSTDFNTDLQPYLVTSAIPSTESVNLRGKLGAYNLYCKFDKVVGTDIVEISVSIPYRTQWEDKETEILSFGELRRFEYVISVPKTYSYWVINQIGVYFPSNLKITNDAFETRTHSINIENADSAIPDYDIGQVGETRDHVIWESNESNNKSNYSMTFDAPYYEGADVSKTYNYIVTDFKSSGVPYYKLTIADEDFMWLISDDYNSAVGFKGADIAGQEPDDPSELVAYLFGFTANFARNDTTQATVKNDNYIFDGFTILSDEKTLQNGDAPNMGLLSNISSRIPLTDYSQMYKTGINLKETSLNKFKNDDCYETEAILTYDNSEDASVNADDNIVSDVSVNGIKVLTPILCTGKILNGVTDDILTIDEQLNFFTVSISNTGVHSSRLGYGFRNFLSSLNPSKSNIKSSNAGVAMNQVKFPFSVYLDVNSDSYISEGVYNVVGDKYYPANTLITIGLDKAVFYIPSTQKVGDYTIEFFTTAINKPINDTSLDYIVNISGAYTVKDTVDIIIEDSVIDFNIIDTDSLTNTVDENNQALDLAIGESFSFKFDSIGKFYGNISRIEIYPEYWYVTKSGDFRTEADIYFSEADKQYITLDDENVVTSNFTFRNTDSLFEISEDTLTCTKDLSSEFRTDTDVNIGNYAKMVLPWNVKYYNRVDMNQISLKYCKQCNVACSIDSSTGCGHSPITIISSDSMEKTDISWYGKFKLPSESYVIPAKYYTSTCVSPTCCKSDYYFEHENICKHCNAVLGTKELFDFNTYRESYTVSGNEDFFMSDGYIYINFDIVIYDNNGNVFRFDSWEDTVVYNDGIKKGYNFILGDVVRYNITKSISDNYEHGGTE